MPYSVEMSVTSLHQTGLANTNHEHNETLLYLLFARSLAQLLGSLLREQMKRLLTLAKMANVFGFRLK